MDKNHDTDDRRYARRSLVLKKNLKKGELINEANIISLRPVKGIPAENFNLVVGKKIKVNKKAGQHLLYKEIYKFKRKK